MSSRLEEILGAVSAVELSTKTRLASYKGGATARGYEFSISDETADRLFRSPCQYCGYQPPHRFNGIDRIVNTIGYVEGNVVACCLWCNRAKGRRPVAEFLAWLKWVRSSSSPVEPVGTVTGLEPPTRLRKRPAAPVITHLATINAIPAPLRWHDIGEGVQALTESAPVFADPSAADLDVPAWQSPLRGLSVREYVRRKVWRID